MRAHVDVSRTRFGLAKITVPIEVVDGPIIDTSYSGMPFKVTHAAIRYTSTKDCREWNCDAVELYGRQVKKDGTVGVRELSKTYFEYCLWPHKDIADLEPDKRLARLLAEHFKPIGHPSLTVQVFEMQV